MNNPTAKRQPLRQAVLRFLAFAALTALLLTVLCITAQAAPSVTFDLGNAAPAVGEGTGEPAEFGVIELLMLVTLIALAPSVLMMMTSFTRIIIVLSFMRSALGTQQSPPNQVLIGISLFLTLFIMFPVLEQINETAYQPYKTGELTRKEFVEVAQVPMKEFMIKQTYTNDLNLFLSIANTGETVNSLIVNGPQDLYDLGLEIIVPSFMTSELKRAFNIGFLLFIPFLIIDIVVSSTLMSMGMVMLPPSMIALPFKIMMFVLVDGWGLLFANLVRGFNRF